MSRTTEQPKGETLNFRIAPTLKAASTAAAEADQKAAAEVLRVFVRAYVERRRRACEAEAGRQSTTIAERSRDRLSDDHASLAEIDASFETDSFGAYWTP